MNKDINLLFEAYKQKVLLNELDLGADYAAAGPEIKKRLGEREAKGNDTYLFKILQDALGKSSAEVADILSKPLYDILFPGGKFAAIGDQKTQLGKLQNAIAANLPKVIEQLQQSEEYGEKLKNAKGLMSSAKQGYTARILRDFLSNVLQFIEGESSGDEAPTEQEVHTAVTKAAKKTAAEAPAPAGEAPAAAGEPEVETADRTTVRIEHMIANLVDDSGVLEKEVISDVDRKIRESGGLGLDEKRVLPKIKLTLDSLVNKKILERKGQYLKLGDNYEQFEAAGEEGSKSIEDIVQDVTGFGSRATTSRQAWGGEGGSYSGVDFG